MPEVVRLLALAVDPPKKSGSTSELIRTPDGKTMRSVDHTGKGGLSLSLPMKSGATRADIDAAIAAVLDRYWS